MGVIPALGFKTNVKDSELAKEVVLAISDEFSNIEYDESRDALSVDSGNYINYSIMDGYNEYVGMHHNALVFDYQSKNWPDWEEYSEMGDLMKEVRDFVDMKFQHIEVKDVMPITPTT
jgi:hypothetical protein